MTEKQLNQVMEMIDGCDESPKQIIEMFNIMDSVEDFVAQMKTAGIEQCTECSTWCESSSLTPNGNDKMCEECFDEMSYPEDEF